MGGSERIPGSSAALDRYGSSALFGFDVRLEVNPK
jgi:hypothetical protein